MRIMMTRKERLIQLQKLAGIFEPPPRLVEQIFHWARSKVAAKVLHNTEINIQKWKATHKDLPDDEQIVELNLLKKECLKYTHEPAVNEVYKRDFPFDLTGWKYKEKPNKHLVNVQLIFQSKPRIAGDWAIPFKIRLFVDDEVYSVQGFHQTLDYLHETIHHELQHAGQSYLSIQPTEKHWMAGLPSKSIQTPADEAEFLPKQERDQPEVLYPLRDIEFYTLLRNEINELKRRLKKMPKSMKMELIRSFVDDHYISDVLTDVSKQLSMEQNWMIVRYFQPSDFFKKLRIYEPSKYRKAVAELWKTISREVE